jgi:hypothetical protein
MIMNLSSLDKDSYGDSTIWILGLPWILLISLLSVSAKKILIRFKQFADKVSIVLKNWSQHQEFLILYVLTQVLKTTETLSAYP